MSVEEPPESKVGYENGFEENEYDDDFMDANGDDEQEDPTDEGHDDDNLMLDRSEDEDSSQPNENDESFETTEDVDDQGEEMYHCEVCKSGFLNLDELFDHYETHDAAQYAFSTELGSETRKWPSRFLKFPSKLFESLTKSMDLATKTKNTNFLNGDVEQRLKFQVRKQLLSGIVKKKFGIRSRYIYKCPHCGKEFQRSDHFRQHVANHTGSKPFVCKLCGKRFSVIITLRRHMGTHAAYKPYKCSKCPRRFNQSGHLKRHEDSPFTHTQPYLQKDYRRRCRLCFDMFPNDNTRLEHERRVHRTDIPVTILRCRYPSCRLVKPTLKLLVDHYKKQHSMNRLNPDMMDQREGGEDDQLVIDESPSSSRSHHPSGGGGPIQEECRMCFEYFGSLSERNIHEHRVHDINNPTTTLQCKYPDCRKILGAKNWLARHIREHRKAIEVGEEPQFEQNGDEEEEMYQEEKQAWECRVCDEFFGGEKERAAHEQFYHESKNPQVKFDCKECSAPVGNFGGLIRHMKEQHEHEGEENAGRPIPMAMATLGLETPPPHLPNLAIGHMQHKQQSPSMVFTCRHCDVQFSDQQVRLNHEYDAHNTRDALDEFFTCKICEKVMTLRGLRKHLRRIHKQVPIIQNGEPGDDQCPMDEEPQPQPTIKKSQKCQMNTVQRTSTKQQNKPTPSKQQQNVPSSSNKQPPANVVYKRTVEPTNSTWVCRLCFEHFDEQRQRETHEHTVHGTNSPNATYSCKYSGCDLEFSTFRALIKHLRSTHGETSVPTQQQKLPVATTTSYKQPTTAFLHNDDGLFKCRLCWEVFPSRGHRSNHESQFHSSETTSNIIPCKFCKYPAVSMKNLIKHLESHGEKDAAAPVSGPRPGREDSGAEKVQLNTNAAIAHENLDAPPRLVPQVKKVNKPLTCRICEDVFPHAKARITHEAKMHHSKNNRQVQICKECGTSLGNFRKLITHIENHHKKRN